MFIPAKWKEKVCPQEMEQHVRPKYENLSNEFIFFGIFTISMNQFLDKNGNSIKFKPCKRLELFFLERKGNSVPTANSGKLINQWSMNWVDLKILSVVCVLLALWWHHGLLPKSWQVRALFVTAVKTFRKNSIEAWTGANLKIFSVNCVLLALW